MYRADYIKYPLIFHVPAGTSRGVLMQKDSWFIRLQYTDQPGKTGIGECSIIPGLSTDNVDGIETTLDEVCKSLNLGEVPRELVLKDYPAIRFALETAVLDLRSKTDKVLYTTGFTAGTKGIPINGLIWMGDKQSMLNQVETKINAGFRILKFKVGALDFIDELELIRSVRARYTSDELEIRLDANGAWDHEEALSKIDRLSAFDIHSIEQPVASGQIEIIASVCKESAIDIALDEELIGVKGEDEIQTLLASVKPVYIILKPSLLGGLEASNEWIRIAEKSNISWWITSALESNIGLNAIAQWTSTLKTTLPQGLGTGQLYTNNITSPLRIIEDRLFYVPEESWDVSNIFIP